MWWYRSEENICWHLSVHIYYFNSLIYGLFYYFVIIFVVVSAGFNRKTPTNRRWPMMITWSDCSAFCFARRSASPRQRGMLWRGLLTATTSGRTSCVDSRLLHWNKSSKTYNVLPSERQARCVDCGSLVKKLISTKFCNSNAMQSAFIIYIACWNRGTR